MADGAGGFDDSDAAEAAIVTNPSGIVPTEYKILVLPDDVPERSAGGIVIPPWCRDQRQGACQTGVVIAVADEAFSFVEGEARTPKVGDRIAYTKYAGMTVPGRDKKVYKLMNDKDVAGILEFAFDPKDYQF
jgi:co-chaperonin GroES (HSP10)